MLNISEKTWLSASRRGNSQCSVVCEFTQAKDNETLEGFHVSSRPLINVSDYFLARLMF